MHLIAICFGTVMTPLIMDLTPSRNDLIQRNSVVRKHCSCLYKYLHPRMRGPLPLVQYRIKRETTLFKRGSHVAHVASCRTDISALVRVHVSSWWIIAQETVGHFE